MSRVLSAVWVRLESSRQLSMVGQAVNALVGSHQRILGASNERRNVEPLWNIPTRSIDRVKNRPKGVRRS